LANPITGIHIDSEFTAVSPKVSKKVDGIRQKSQFS
jgi:hypothetical protein